MKETLFRNVQTIEVLRQLLDVLSETTKAWERFNLHNGDINHFSAAAFTENSQSAYRSLHYINKVFDNLEGLQRKLQRQETVCQDLSQAVS